MKFASPYFLFLLLLLPLLFTRWKKRATPARVSFSVHIPGQVQSRDPEWVLLALRVLSLALLIVALARPQSSHHQVERTVSGVDIMLLLDVSASMQIEDLGEESRIELAKHTMESFIQGRQNDRIGLTIFSGEPLSLVPPTLDYGLLLTQLRKIELGTLRDGTAIGDGLAVAINHLRNSKAKSRVIILLTDGDNNLGQVGPETAGELAAGYGLKVYTIAIGKEGRVKLPIRQRTLTGRIITTYQWLNSALNPELLIKIAELTQGKFYRVTDLDTLQDVFKEIDQLEKTEIKAHEKIRYDEKFMPWAAVGFLLLMLELVGRSMVRRVP